MVLFPCRTHRLARSRSTSGPGAALRAGAALLAGVAVLAACGGDDAEDPPGAEPATVEDVTGRSFVSSAVEGVELVEGTWVTIVFEEDRLSVVAGCNTMFGPYSFDDGVLVATDLAGTLMMCEPDVQAQDGWVGNLLMGNPAATYADDRLTLASEEITLTLDAVEPPSSAHPLDGSAWTIRSLDVDDSTVDAPDGASIAYSRGAVSIATGCNRASGTLEVGEGAVTIGPVVTTLMACEPDLAEWESALLEFVEADLTYELTDDVLVLRRDGRTLTLVSVAGEGG